MMVIMATPNVWQLKAKQQVDQDVNCEIERDRVKGRSWREEVGREEKKRRGRE